MSYDVFISHRSLYKSWVITLANNLIRQGHKVWLDAWELIPGRNYVPGLHEGLQKSRKAILVATPDTVDSGWVREEYDAMLIRKQHHPGFSFVPLVFGPFPDLPFLENIHCVDFRDPSPEAYRRAFYHLLCGLEDRAPGSGEKLDGALEIPEPIQQASQPLQGSEQDFLKRIFDTLASVHVPLLLLAQADQGQGNLIQGILERARERFGQQGVLHVTPPYSRGVDISEYFAYLGRQCRFAEPVISAFHWDNALDQRLRQGNRLFLLVSGFENGTETGRRELAGVLRSLNDTHVHRLQVVLCGGERLAELKYGPSHLSLLNYAEVLWWPELTLADVLTLQGQDFPDVTLSEAEAQLLLRICGGHPRLLRYCLQRRREERNLSSNAWQQELEDYYYVSDLFLHYREDVVAQSDLCNWLKAETFGVFEYWPADQLLRQLYWRNLLVKRERRFAWRCEVLRKAGQRVLKCCTS